MATKSEDEEKCRKCWGRVGSRHKSICCDICNRWFHFKCSQLSKEEFEDYVLNTHKIWRCSYCQIYRCMKCTRAIKIKQNSICCDVCENWYHLKCTSLSITEFKKLGRLDNNDSWFCKGCIHDALPSSNLDNKQLIKLFNNKKTINNFVKQNPTQYHKFCNICNKHNNIIDKAIPCSNCKCLIHRKCTKLPAGQLENNE